MPKVLGKNSYVVIEGLVITSKWGHFWMFSRTIHFYPTWGPSFILSWNYTKLRETSGEDQPLMRSAHGSHASAQAGHLTHTFSDRWNPWVPLRDRVGAQKPFQPVRWLLPKLAPWWELLTPTEGQLNHPTGQTQAFTHYCCHGRGTAGFIQIDSHPQLKGFRKMSRHDHN